MHRPLRKLTLLAIVAALPILLGGCVVIKSQSANQQGTIGGVEVDTTACASDTLGGHSGYNPADPDCQGSGHGGNSSLDAADGSYQLLLAYRVPAAATAPDSITTDVPAGAGAITFSASSDYSAALEAGSPTPGGERWAGYISEVVNYTTGGEQYFSVSPTFGLRRGPDGAPFQGPFTYRVAVGSRVVDGSNPASRPVACADPVTALSVSEQTICVDDPDPATLATDLEQPTRDLGILDAPGPQTYRQGNIARVDFDARYATSGRSRTFDLSASTDLPGAAPVPSAPSLVADPGDNPIQVLFRIPVRTQPGPYDVTLTATASDGSTRSSTHRIVIEPTRVRCRGKSPLIAGTRGDDILIGTPGPDVIAAYDGDDVILGRGGNDTICAGRGDDRVYGGAGNDRIAGRDGGDMLDGGPGRNLMLGGAGRNILKP